eukprot:TRINITY_DN26933_c0_g1_i2.p1 TRINITY_DN26933_c0_g1~~TRINITY_DN26933_c0_g1_i2.p1  ORF type:complete len:326 (+),score=34.67 TRINITY_DN26933_c0_g1_i2:96-1073(+)
MVCRPSIISQLSFLRRHLRKSGNNAAASLISQAVWTLLYDSGQCSATPEAANQKPREVLCLAELLPPAFAHPVETQKNKRVLQEMDVDTKVDPSATGCSCVDIDDASLELVLDADSILESRTPRPSSSVCGLIDDDWLHKHALRSHVDPLAGEAELRTLSCLDVLGKSNESHCDKNFDSESFKSVESQSDQECDSGVESENKLNVSDDENDEESRRAQWQCMRQKQIEEARSMPLEEYPVSEHPPSAYQIFTAFMVRSMQTRGLDVDDRENLMVIARAARDGWDDLDEEKREDMMDFAKRIKNNWNCEKYNWRKHPGRCFWTQIE